MGVPVHGVIILDLDGVAFDPAPAVQAFARRVTQSLEPAATTRVIDGMRGYLEGRWLAGPDSAVDAATDGWAAVDLLAQREALPPASRSSAARQAFDDLLGLAWSLDIAPGLVEWLSRVPPEVVVLGSSQRGSPSALIEALRLPGVVISPDQTLDDLAPAGTLVSGTRWAGGLESAPRGIDTLYLDDRGRGDGTPTIRVPSRDRVVAALDSWVRSRLPQAAVT